MAIQKLQSPLFVLLILIAPVLSAAERGKTIVMQGNGNGATACMACHGVKGQGQAEAKYPALAGLNAAYLEKQLNDFAANKRRNPTMAPNASALSPSERKAVAEYFASLPAVSQTPKISDSERKLGKALAVNGNWDKNIPACFSCHGSRAGGVPPHFPALAGQHASYITQQINAWKSGERSNDPNNLMKSVAERLSGKEVKAVSAYLASLPAPKQ